MPHGLELISINFVSLAGGAIEAIRLRVIEKKPPHKMLAVVKSIGTFR